MKKKVQIIGEVKYIIKYGTKKLQNYSYEDLLRLEQKVKFQLEQLKQFSIFGSIFTVLFTFYNTSVTVGMEENATTTVNFYLILQALLTFAVIIFVGIFISRHGKLLRIFNEIERRKTIKQNIITKRNEMLKNKYLKK